MKNLVWASSVVGGIASTWRAYKIVHLPALCLQNLTENNFDKCIYPGFMGIKQPGFYPLHLSSVQSWPENHIFFHLEPD